MSRRFLTPSKIPAYLICSICTEVFKTPFRINCGHTFCKECIFRWLEDNKTCPVCRKLFSKKTTRIDSIADQVVNDLQVICMHKGCSWTGPLKESEDHAYICVFHPDRLEPWIADKIPEKNLGEEKDLDIEAESSLLCSLYLHHPNVLRQILSPEIHSKDKCSFKLFDDSDEEI